MAPASAPRVQKSPPAWDPEDFGLVALREHSAPYSARARHREQVAIPGRLRGVGGQEAVWGGENSDREILRGTVLSIEPRPRRLALRAAPVPRLPREVAHSTLPARLFR